jgi:hypothetical protein
VVALRAKTGNFITFMRSIKTAAVLRTALTLSALVGLLAVAGCNVDSMFSEQDDFGEKSMQRHYDNGDMNTYQYDSSSKFFSPGGNITSGNVTGGNSTSGNTTSGNISGGNVTNGTVQTIPDLTPVPPATSAEPVTPTPPTPGSTATP